MLIDHIYIFVDSKQKAQALIDFGLCEGSGNVHKGIGTANRRFFFKNFYLEILWVENELEAKSTKELGMWERSNYQKNNYSRFGLCLEHTEDTNQVFENAIVWQPAFLQKNEYVNILTNQNMPWIFRFPKNRVKDLSDEPRVHKIKMSSLTKAIFTLPEIEFENTLNYIANNSIVEFREGTGNSLTLEFDNAQKGMIQVIKELDLVIRY